MLSALLIYCIELPAQTGTGRFQFSSINRRSFQKYRYSSSAPVLCNSSRLYKVTQESIGLEINMTTKYIVNRKLYIWFEFREHGRPNFNGIPSVVLWYPRSRVRSRPKPSDFSGRKNPQHAFLGGEVKPSPMSQICAACQRTLSLRGSRNHGQN